MSPMPRLRWAALALAALLALQTPTTRAAEAECLADGASCAIADGCPAVCCMGMPPREVGAFKRCPESSKVFREDNTTSSNTTWVPLSAGPSPTIAAAAASMDDAATPDEGDAALTSGSTQDNNAGVAETDAPAPTQAPSSVDAFQSTQGLASSRGGLGGSSTIFIAVGALAGCVVLVAAVMYKRKSGTTKDLEIPGSSYQGTNGSGLTPDNRSLDGMMEGGARGSTESMKQLPVLSMAGREGSSIVARLSSPFGQNTARISSPAHRGGTNEDYAFDVEMGSRAGSSVQVAFVDTSDQSTEFVPEKNGVVAL